MIVIISEVTPKVNLIFKDQARMGSLLASCQAACGESVFGAGAHFDALAIRGAQLEDAQLTTVATLVSSLAPSYLTSRQTVRLIELVSGEVAKELGKDFYFTGSCHIFYLYCEQ